MANKIQFKRGLKSKLTTLSAGEPAYTTDTREFFIGTGSGNVNIGGSQWQIGTAMTGKSTGVTYGYSACPQVKVGDIYLNPSTGFIYQCTTAGSGTTARWTYMGGFKGESGPSVLFASFPNIPTLEGDYGFNNSYGKCFASVQFPVDGDIFFIKGDPDKADEDSANIIIDPDGYVWGARDPVTNRYVNIRSDTSYLGVIVQDYYEEETGIMGGRYLVLASGEAKTVQELAIKTMFNL